MRKLIIVIVLLVVVAGAGFGWYYFQGPCGTSKVNKAIDDMSTVAEEFDDAFAVANSTARMSLSGPISEMQNVKRNADDIVVPVCLENAKQLLVGGMQTSIDGFIAFLGQEPDDVVTSYFVDAGQQLAIATDEMETISECAPFCKADPHKVVP